MERGPYAKGVAKREEILTTALEVVSRRGFGGASVKELADAVGLTPAGLLHYFGSNPLSGVHRGKARALQVLAEFSRRTRRRLLAIVATMAGPERGAIVARESFGTVEIERVLVYSVVDGKLHECWVYDEDPMLVDRLVMNSAA